MPYKAFKSGDEWCVYKLDSSDNKTGGSLGCHSSKGKANAQVRALYASENKEINMEIENEVKARDIPEEEDVDEKGMYADYYTGEVHDDTEYVPYGVKTFEEYEEVVAAKKAAEKNKKDLDTYKQITDNIVNSSDIEDKPGAIMRLTNEFISKLRDTTSGIKDFFNKPKEKEYSFETSFMVFKDKEGELKWISRYSNNCRDQDYPPEIISKESHEYYEDLVDKGAIPMPELWVWHMPLKIGNAEVVTFDKENGIAIAAGRFDENDAAKEFAQLVADNPDEWGTSHGMPGQFIERSKEDPTIITKHITKEISILPKYAAANKWADFQVLKEVDMTIKQEKLEQLKTLGASEQMLADLESGNKELADAFEELGVERKEITPKATEEKEKHEDDMEDDTEEEMDEGKKEVAKVEAVEEKEVAEEIDDSLKKQLAEAMTEIGVTLKQLNERIDGLEAKQVEDEETKEAIPEDMPPMALKEYLYQSMNFKGNSARESDDTVIDGRKSLAKAKPAENETKEKPRIVDTGNPLLNDTIAGLFTENEQPA